MTRNRRLFVVVVSVMVVLFWSYSTYGQEPSDGEQQAVEMNVFLMKWFPLVVTGLGVLMCVLLGIIWLELQEINKGVAKLEETVKNKS